MKRVADLVQRRSGLHAVLGFLVFVRSHLLVFGARQLRTRSFQEPADVGGQVVLPWTLFDGNASDVAARARAAEALSAGPGWPAAAAGSVGFSANASAFPAAGLDSSAGASGGNVSARAQSPHLFFLFMAYGSMSHMDLWSAFFQQASASKWSAFLHCKSQDACRFHLSMMNPFGLRLIDSAPSTYCHDLVSPMVQLLRAASAESQHHGDKFVFISDTTLPVKPFAFVYDALTQNPYSDICIEPRSEWLWLSNKRSPGRTAALVKHSQWVVLSQEHARRMVRRWPHMSRGVGSHWSVPVWPAAKREDYTEEDFGSLPQHSLCTDEWAVFAALFGVVMTARTSEEMPGLSSQVLNIQADTPEDGQGVCRTFVTWGESVARDSSRVAQKLSQMLSCFPNCLSSHPAHFTRMTYEGLQVLRASNFLFARKFPSGVVDKGVFARAILAPN